jgi:DNA-binding MarR family transcriptional regulator
MPIPNEMPLRAARPTHVKFNVEEFVPYLLNFVGGRWVYGFAPRLREFDVSYSLFRVLLILWQFGPLHLIEIANRANFDLSTLSRVVADLQERSLVRRALTRRRGRNFAVKLTRAGTNVVRSLLPIALDHEASVLAGLSPGERLLLIELLQRLAANVTGRRNPRIDDRAVG